ncbi:9677_t:CDS:2, partial [Acaulospora colombiana]
TLLTLSDIFKDLYVFTDQSKEPPENGFDFTPMDILKVLDTFLDNKHYTTDFEFYKDLRFTIKKLRDGHTDLISGCYFYNVLFDQQIYLYSVVENEKQLIKVFDDSVDRKNVDCEVTHINSKPALQVITEFARTQLSTSRDLGVRFNDALVSVSQTKIAFTSNLFSVRNDLPESGSITYSLKCPNRKPFQLTRKWSIITNTFSRWNDTKTFQQYCSSTFPISSIPEQKNASSSTYGKAELVFEGTAANAYTIGKDLGVVEINTFSFHRVRGFIEIGYKLALQELAKRGVKKVVIDFSNNPGGFITFSIFLNGLLVPSKHIAFPTDLRVPPIIQKAIQRESGSNDSGGFYQASGWNSFVTGKPFTSADQFIGNRSLTRGGTTNRYSALFNDILTDQEINELKKKTKFPWDKDSIIILTNGHCASACALASQYLTEIGQYQTVAVGGFLNQSLSFSTFPGGELLNDGILPEINAPHQFQSNLAFSFTIREAYSLKNLTEVLDFKYKPADHRLSYDERNARDISLLWEQAASFLK